MKKKLLVSLATVLLLSGCSKIPTLENGQEVIAELDGLSITVDELYQKTKVQYGTSVLVDMIDKFILDKEVATDDDMTNSVNAGYESQKYTYEAYYQESYGYNFDEYLELAFGGSENFKETILYSLKQEKVIEAYVGNTITDKDVEKYYKDDSKIAGNIVSRHILITPETTEDMSDEKVEEAENKAFEKANELIKKLNAGEKFEDLAKEHSDDTASAKEGGLIEPFNRNSNLVASYIDAAYKLKVGEYTTSPVESQFGYHIILKVSQEDKPKLEDVKDEIIKTMTKEKIEADTDQLLSYKALINLREKYNLKIVDTDLEKLYNTTIKKYK